MQLPTTPKSPTQAEEWDQTDLMVALRGVSDDKLEFMVESHIEFLRERAKGVEHDWEDVTGPAAAQVLMERKTGKGRCSGAVRPAARFSLQTE
jgi:hypothetical protein